MTSWRRVAAPVTLASIGLVVALGTGPVSTRQILAGYVLVLAAIALGATTRLTRTPEPWQQGSEFERALEPQRIERVRPAELVRTERELTLGTASASHLQARLLPLLREAAAARLAAHHNVDLDRRSEAARRLLGDSSWQILRPEPEATAGSPLDQAAPGMPLRRVAALLDSLERL